MFAEDQFKRNVRLSFGRVRTDVGEFKRSVTDWILYLDNQVREMQHRISELERENKELKADRLVAYH